MDTFFEKLYATRQKRPALKAILLFSEIKPEELEDIAQRRKKLAKLYNISLTKLDDDLYRLNIKRFIWSRYISGSALIDTRFKNMWVVFCNERSYFVKRALERLFTGLYPNISRLYLNYSKLHTLLNRVKESYKGQTTLTSFIIKRNPKYPESFREQQKRELKGTVQLWEENAEEELRKQSEIYRVTVDIVNFEVKNEEGIILLQAQISRRGICKLRFGSFSAFYENVIQNALELGLNWRNFYGHRERIIQEGRILLKPLRIGYPFELDEAQLHRLAGKISKIYSCSIIHGGNPYFVAILCDYQDGSSFGVTALGKSVTITPITRGSPQATWKLTNRIQEILGDGEITSISG